VNTDPKQKSRTKEFFKLFLPYKWVTGGLLLLTLIVSGINLYVPKVISRAIDTFARGTFDQSSLITRFGLVIAVTLVISLLQTFLQTRLAENVGRDLRNRIADKISRLSYRQVLNQTPSKLLTNFTSDIDAIKQFVALGFVMLTSSIILIIGSGILLFSINAKLAGIVMSILPLILIAFLVIFKNVGDLFTRSQAVTDALNRVISENIFGASLIRVLNSQYEEIVKFKYSNEESKSIGTDILKMFATLLPIITTVANLSVLAIIFFGGRAILGGELSIGEFVQFYNYISLLIFPIIVLGFISSQLGSSFASYQRIADVLEIEEEPEDGTIKKDLEGIIEFKNVSLTIANQSILRDISFKIMPGKTTAILGPTAAGKTQIFYLLANLIRKDSGEILYGGVHAEDLEKDTFFKQIGLVFQDSIIFNTSVKENIAFRDDIEPEALQKAIQTAELEAFIDALPQGIDTIISERGTSLSGGQKQRLTLARALALNPKVLLLDDFTARVDNETERRIFENIDKNYPNITKVLITQKISSIKNADQIIVLMEGELLATGNHDELIRTSFEYKQIAESQQTTE
jgi:ATP-binding cassette, subfamily B, bacterial